MRFKSSLGPSIAALSVLALAPGFAADPSLPPSGEIVSAEPSSYEAVTRQLDPYGSFHLYLSTETFLTEAAEKLAEVVPKLLTAAKMGAEEQAKAEALWKSLSKLTGASGLNDISGFGASTIALEKGYYKSKWMLHHYEGKGTGFLWNLPGNTASAMDIIGYLPKQTVLTVSADLTLAPLWKALAVQEESNKELSAGLQLAAKYVEVGTGFPLEALLAGVGPNFSLVVTLDPSRPATWPADPTPVAMPEPALALCIQVQDEAMLSRVEKELGKLPGVITADQGEFKIRVVPTLPATVTLPFVRAAVAWKKGLLIVSSQEALILEMLAVKAGKSPGLTTVPEFTNLMRAMPKSACMFEFTAPLFEKTFNDLNETNFTKAMGSSFDDVFGSMRSKEQTRWSCSTLQNTPTGWLSESRGQTGSMGTIGIAVPAIVVGSAIAVPFFFFSKVDHSPKPEKGKKALPGKATQIKSGGNPNSPRLSEFQGDEIGLVLRTLARQAGVVMIISDKVSAAGTVTARIENKTPLQAIEIIVDAKGLVMNRKDGVLYVKTQEEKASEPPPKVIKKANGGKKAGR